jgi:hypothetical protein
MRRSQVARIALGALAAAGLLALLAAERGAEAEPQGIPAVARATLAAVPPRAVFVQTEDDATVAPATPATALSELIAEAERLKAMARYPRWSQPLDLLGDPLAEDEAITVYSSGSNADQPVLAVYCEHRIFDAPAPVTIRAHLMTTAGLIPAQITATVLDQAARPVLDLVFSNDTQGYLATFTPPPSAAANANYSIQVQATSAEHQRRSASIEIVYNQPYARLTGNFRDRVENGDLVIEAEVSVLRRAEFHINGSLYGAADQQQIAWAEASRSLRAGTSWLPLKFHGLILREQQVNGPYLLRFVSLTAQTADTEATMRAVHNAHTTQPYDADAFNGKPGHDSRAAGPCVGAAWPHRPATRRAVAEPAVPRR